jgi:hypothetical protein
MTTLGPYPLNSIITGDARELAQAIPDERVDLIFTDPVYQKPEDYQWLSVESMRVLKPNSAALIWCGIGYLPETISALVSGGLQYKWQMVAAHPMGFPSRYCMNKVFSNWQSLLWFEKGKSRPIETISDLVFSNNPGSMMYHKDWAKNINPFLHWLSRFTEPGAVVFDPFSGGGTVPVACKSLGRDFVAFEILPELAERARVRVQNTQPPLFTIQPEQSSFLEAS